MPGVSPVFRSNIEVKRNVPVFGFYKGSLPCNVHSSCYLCIYPVKYPDDAAVASPGIFDPGNYPVTVHGAQGRPRRYEHIPFAGLLRNNKPVTIAVSLKVACSKTHGVRRAV